jgi:hypothetical protein
MFPDDVGPGDDGSDAPGGHGGPVVAGGLAARSQVRSRSGSADDPDAQGDDEFADEGQPGAPLGSDRVETAPPPPGSIGAAVEAGSLPVASASAAVVGALPDEPEPAQTGWLRRHWRAVAAVAVVAGVLLVGALGFLWWLSSQWFVGPNAGYVAIFQGIPQQVAGVPLNRVVTRTALPLGSLPYYDQAQLSGTLDAATESEAQRIVTDLEAKSASCTSGQAPLGCPVVQPGTGAGTTLPSPSPSPTASPGALR